MHGRRLAPTHSDVWKPRRCHQCCHTGSASSPPDRLPEYLDDAVLSDEERRTLAEHITPRRALDGRLVWPINELRADGKE